MKPPGIRSLDVVLVEVRIERQAQLSHFEALDAKAGIVLGFAGALVALAPNHYQVLPIVGRALAVASGFFALFTFWPRRYRVLDLLALRDRYLEPNRSSPSSTSLTPRSLRPSKLEA